MTKYVWITDRLSRGKVTFAPMIDLLKPTGYVMHQQV